MPSFDRDNASCAIDIRDFVKLKTQLPKFRTPGNCAARSWLTVICAQKWRLGDTGTSFWERKRPSLEDDAWVEDASHLRSIRDDDGVRSPLVSLGGALCLARVDGIPQNLLNRLVGVDPSPGPTTNEETAN